MQIASQTPHERENRAGMDVFYHESALMSQEKNYTLWHEHFGYHGITRMKRLCEMIGITVNRPENLRCEGSQQGKQTRTPLKTRVSKWTEIGMLIHSDVCGPIRSGEIGENRYFVIFVDDFSGFIWI
jgi:hypothetical protein